LRNQGPKGDLVVEAGGYRFAPKPVIKRFGPGLWRIATPLTAKIIKELKLPTAVYNPNASQWDHGMYKIVTPDGQDAGYLTFIERMLDRAVARGTKLRFGAPVVALHAIADGESKGRVEAVTMTLDSGEKVNVRSVVLNIPQRPLLELLRRSGGELTATFPKPLYNPVSHPLMKLYVHYDDAWWRNELGLTSGTFITEEPPLPANDPRMWAPVDFPAPLSGQYHDGDVKCDLPGGKCRGFLQAFYGGDSGPFVPFFVPFVDAVTNDPAVTLDPKVEHHRALLEVVHASLVHYHRDALLAAHGGGAAGEATLRRVESMRPSGAVLTIWDQGVKGLNAACHMPKREPSGAEPEPGTLAKGALEPFPGWPLYVANEAFGPMRCFAEGSLAMAEAALRRMNVSGPASGWLEDDFANALLDEDFNKGRPPTDPFLLARFEKDAEAPNVVI